MSDIAESPVLWAYGLDRQTATGKVRVSEGSMNRETGQGRTVQPSLVKDNGRTWGYSQEVKARLFAAVSLVRFQLPLLVTQITNQLTKENIMAKKITTNFISRIISATSAEEMQKVKDEAVSAYRKMIHESISDAPACDIQFILQALMDETQTISTNAAESIG